jgi:hypothetical protein
VNLPRICSGDHGLSVRGIVCEWLIPLSQLQLSKTEWRWAKGRGVEIENVNLMGAVT